MWKTVRLGDVCKIIGGGTPKSNEKNYWEGNIQWLTPKDMGKLSSRYVANTERKITIDGLNNSSAKLVPSQSVILSCRAPIGHVFINEVEMSFNQGCKGLITTDEITVEYLYYFLFSSKQLLNDLGTGTTFKEISGKTLANVTISYPPLAEQQRIVAKLDAAFAEIDRAIEVSSSSKHQSEQLLEKMLSEEFCSAPKKQSMKFADVCTLQRGFDLPKSQRQAGSFPLFSANGITDYIDAAKIAAPGVITGRSGTIGAVHYTEKEFWALNTALYVKDFKGNLPKYVFYFLKSFDLKKYASGAGVPTLNRNVLSDEIVWIADGHSEQQSTCEKLDEATEQVSSLSQILNEQIVNYQALKSSILAQELKSEAA